MNLHENKNFFTAVISEISQNIGILDVYIEKDYWLTRVLQRMANNPNAEKVVFKGGTALSKAFRLTKQPKILHYSKISLLCG